MTDRGSLVDRPAPDPCFRCFAVSILRRWQGWRRFLVYMNGFRLFCTQLSVLAARKELFANLACVARAGAVLRAADDASAIVGALGAASAASATFAATFAACAASFRQHP